MIKKSNAEVKIYVTFVFRSIAFPVASSKDSLTPSPSHIQKRKTIPPKKEKKTQKKTNVYDKTLTPTPPTSSA